MMKSGILLWLLITIIYSNVYSQLGGTGVYLQASTGIGIPCSLKEVNNCVTQEFGIEGGLTVEVKKELFLKVGGGYHFKEFRSEPDSKSLSGIHPQGNTHFGYYSMHVGITKVFYPVFLKESVPVGVKVIYGVPRTITPLHDVNWNIIEGTLEYSSNVGVSLDLGYQFELSRKIGLVTTLTYKYLPFNKGDVYSEDVVELVDYADRINGSSLELSLVFIKSI